MLNSKFKIPTSIFVAIKLTSASVVGLTVKPVTVEIDMESGLHTFRIVGLPDKAVEESRERVAAAVRAANAKPPHRFNKKIILNLAPADLKKQGPAFDVPIALAFLAASKQLALPTGAERFMIAGELALDGTIRPIQGALPIALFARDHKFILVIPRDNRAEASLVKGLSFLAVESLKELIAALEHFNASAVTRGEGVAPSLAAPLHSDFDMGFIRGQEQAKRALEIAAAGAHHALLDGSPGSGKTMLARAMPTILPRMSEEETLEVTKLWSVAGLLHAERPLVTERPFRAPHHSASLVSIVGGGTFPRPGEISLAHRGVLFLDEFPEFPRQILEALRQPLEDGEITVARAKDTVIYPARFSLIAAQNPCPCGNAGDPEQTCICTAGDLARYHRKVSGPILDRIDLVVNVPRLPFEKLTEDSAEPSDAIRMRVEAARARQTARFSKLTFRTNAEMSTRHVTRFCALDLPGTAMLKHAHDAFRLSPRAHFRILKVARTIADLAEEEKITSNHVAEALQYRQRRE